jgi:tRNA-splicing ligase RtcB (3'-phosphate/5'-hydroxy nucleic acid ligase)
VLNPDTHAGYGAPVGCVLTSPTHIYPGPVGVDIKCSMSFLQLDLPADQVADKTVRRALIDAILERTPTGPDRGQRSARKARKVREALRGESRHGWRVAGSVARAWHSAGMGGVL